MSDIGKPRCLDEWGLRPAHYRLVASGSDRFYALTLEQHDRDDAMGAPVWTRIACARPNADYERDGGESPVIRLLLERLDQVQPSCVLFSFRTSRSHDADWRPPLGRLFARFQIAPWEHEIVLGYADNEVQWEHYQTVARIRDWDAGPYFGGWVESRPGVMRQISSSAVVVRRLAEKKDVEALVKLWASDDAKTPPGLRCSIAEWLNRVLESALCDEDKAMVAGVVNAEAARALTQLRESAVAAGLEWSYPRLSFQGSQPELEWLRGDRMLRLYWEPERGRRALKISGERVEDAGSIIDFAALYRWLIGEEEG